MTVKELKEILENCDGATPVLIMTLGGYGEVFDAAECLPNGRCKVNHMELTTVDVPGEYLGTRK